MGAPAAGSTGAPKTIEEFLWNIHSVLVAAGPLELDKLREEYATQLGHKCIIERFLVVGEGGLAATLKRIPHAVTIFSDSSGVTCLKATQPSNITRQQLVDADLQYRKEIMKRNAAKAASMSSSKATAPVAAPPSANAPPKAVAPAEANKKQKTESETETLARMLVQGVVRVLQNRVKAGQGPLPISELEAEFTKLWKVPFNLQQAGETDTVTFLRKWPGKVDVIQDIGALCVQLAKKVPEKAKAAEAPAAVKAGSTAQAPAGVPAAAKSMMPAAKGIAVTSPPAATKPGTDVAAAKGPTRPPASVEDFLWNIYSVLEAHGSPMPLNKLKDAYAQHLGHKCAIERFLVIGEGGLAATFKRIPHVVTVAQDAAGNVSLKPTLGPGATKETLIAEDQKYRKQLQRKNAVAPAPTEAATKTSAAAPAEGEKDPKKARTEDPDTLSRMLIQGVVRVLQNRQKDGKGALLVSDLEAEFKALWKVPFNLQQAGETDVVVFLKKWQAKVDVVDAGGKLMVQLAKRVAEKATPTATKAPPPKARVLASADELGKLATPALQLSELRQQAVGMLTVMRDLVQKQEAFVQTLNQLSSDGTA